MAVLLEEATRREAKSSAIGPNGELQLSFGPIRSQRSSWGWTGDYLRNSNADSSTQPSYISSALALMVVVLMCAGSGYGSPRPGLISETVDVSSELARSYRDAHSSQVEPNLDQNGAGILLARPGCNLTTMARLTSSFPSAPLFSSTRQPRTLDIRHAPITPGNNDEPVTFTARNGTDPSTKIRTTITAFRSASRPFRHSSRPQT